jgi:hypothetical protein
VLPPIARLTPDQALYHFLSGCTSKLAGTFGAREKRPASARQQRSAAPARHARPMGRFDRPRRMAFASDDAVGAGNDGKHETCAPSARMMSNALALRHVAEPVSGVGRSI